MDWRLFSAVTLAGASFSMVAFGAYALRAADVVSHDADRSAPPLVAPSLTLPGAPGAAAGISAVRLSAAATLVPERGVSFVPVAPNSVAPNVITSGDAALAPTLGTERPEQPGMQLAAIDGASPVLVADLPVSQDKAARPAWRHRHHVTWKVGHRARFCTVLRPCTTDRKQVAVKHDEHPAPKVALILGVGF
jgi:hypothetical protein